jgi:hypothetical protein
MGASQVRLKELAVIDEGEGHGRAPDQDCKVPGLQKLKTLRLQDYQRSSQDNGFGTGPL